MKEKLAILFLLLLMPVAVITTGFSSVGSFIIRGNITVDGESLRGLSLREAKAYLFEKTREEAEAKTLTVKGRNCEYKFYYPEIDVVTNINEIIKTAISARQNAEMELYIQRTYYLKNIDEILDGIEYENYREEKDAEIEFYPDRAEKFRIKGEVDGYRLDREKLKRDITGALQEKDSVAVCDYVKIPAKVRKEELSGYTSLRGKFRTYYGYSGEERKHNIALAAKKLNGAFLDDGEVLSFNETVGKRSEENGFKSAKIILGGRFTEGVGGGVCQVSTTLYNAALLSGLNVDEFHSHSLTVSYVPPSRDAMVNSGSSDLKIRNATGGPVFIKAQADGEYVTFEFYGKPVEKGVTYRIESVTLKTISPEPPEVFVDDLKEYTDLLPGQSRVLENAKEGVVSESYFITLKNGAETGRIKLRTDKYAPMKGRVVVGGAAEEEEKIS